MSEQRRLAAILVADVVGYSKLIGSDEAGTLAQLQATRILRRKDIACFSRRALTGKCASAGNVGVARAARSELTFNAITRR